MNNRTSLEIAQSNEKKICCNNCKNRIIVKDANYCGVNGKMILPMHLDSERKEQCKDRMEKGGEYIWI